NAFGPRSHFEGDSGEVLPRFVLQALVGRPLIVFGDGTQTRDLTHVYDTAAAMARAAIVPGVEGKTFNIGSGKELSNNDLAEIVKISASAPELSIVHVEPRPGDVLRLLADSTAAARDLCYRAVVSIEQGIADLVDRFRVLGTERLDRLASTIVVKNWQ